MSGDLVVPHVGWDLRPTGTYFRMIGVREYQPDARASGYLPSIRFPSIRFRFAPLGILR